MKYCTKQDLENYLLITIDESFSNQVDVWIDGVSRMLDNYADRKLVADEMGSGDEYEVKYYDGNGSCWLYIDDAIEIDSVEVDDSAVDYTHYPKLPPFRKLRGSFPCGVQNVKVTGRFGYFDSLDDAPDVRFACTVIVSGIINASNPNIQRKHSEKIGHYSVVYSDDKGIADYRHAMVMLDSYKKMSF